MKSPDPIESLPWRLSLQMLLLAILPALTVSWLSYRALAENIRSESVKIVGSIADTRHERLNMLLTKAKMRANSLMSTLSSECSDAADKLDQDCATRLIRHFTALEGATGAHLHIAKSGAMLTVGDTVEHDEAPAFPAGQLARFSGIGARDNRTFFIQAGEPSGNLRLEVTYPSAILAPIFERPKELGDSGETFLADGEGYFVTPARYHAVQGHEAGITVRPMRLCLNRKSGETLDPDYRGVPVIHGYRFIPELGSACIMAHIEQDEAFSSIGTLAGQLGTAIGIFILLIAGVVIYLARSIARPIVNLTNKLCQSEARLRLLLDSAAEAIYGIDRNGNCTFCNPSCLKLLGYTHSSELVGRNMHELIHHKRPDGSRFPVEECRIYMAFLASKKTHVEGEVFWRPDGTSFPVEYWSHPQIFDGATIGAVVSFFDISERKLAEEKLLKLSRAVENSPASVVITDRDGVIEYTNKRFAAITGYAAEEVIGKTPSILNSGIHSEEFYKNLWSTILAGREWQGEMTNRKKNGEIFIEHALISPICDEKGNITDFVCIKEDITERKRVAEALHQAEQERALLAVRQEDEARLRAIVDTAHDAMVQIDSRDIVTGWNKRAEIIFGWSAQEAVGRILSRTIIPGQHREAHEKGLERYLLTAEGGMLNALVETTAVHRDGHEFPVELSITSIRVSGHYEFNAFIRDISGRKQAEAELAEKESQYRLAVETSMDGFWMSDAKGQLLKVNDAYARLSGYTREELCGMNVTSLEAEERGGETEAHIREIIQKGYGKFESRHRKKDGSIWPVQVSAIFSTGMGGRFFVFISDLTERKLVEEKMSHLAQYDTLTDLPNRSLLYDRLSQEVKKAHRSNQKVALLFMDIDHFKEINDTLGHSKGDMLLKEAARRIGDCVRETDTVARLGGDEFIIILPDFETNGNIERVADHVLRRLSDPFLLEEEVVYVSASIGITLYPDDAAEADGLLKNADQAMYVAKRGGRNQRSYFTSALQDAALSRMRTISDLRSALVDGQFRVYYQPIVDLKSGRTHKAEALIRWRHPERGLVSPAEFIPLSEETGLITEIGFWVFQQAAQQVKRWRETISREFQVSVNRSPVQFRQRIKQDALPCLQYLTEIQLAGDSVVFEITEGLLLEADTAVKNTLLQFRSAGIQIALDDFGTGYSSLSYLKKFDLDYVKIDRSFVEHLETDINNIALCEAIIVMAHKLELKVIAEGIETEEQRRILADAGCDYGQGYLFSKPVPPEEFEKLLAGG